MPRRAAVPPEAAGAPLLIDSKRFGQLLRGARYAADRSMEQVVAAVNLLGPRFPVSERILRGIERGERLPDESEMTALMLVLQPSGGRAYFLPAVRQDAQEAWLRGQAGGNRSARDHRE